MARIRSIHPGFLTDEEVMALTVEAPIALILLIGLWGEADDHGLFEWKPHTIKARTLPSTTAPVALLLETLVERKFIKKVAIDGREYGAVRNFMVFQRPRRPSYQHPTTEDVLQYVGLHRRKSPTEPVSAEDEADTDGNVDTSSIPIPDNVRKPDAVGGKGRVEKGKKDNGAIAPLDAPLQTEPFDLSPPPLEKPQGEIAEAFAIWNETATECALPKAQLLTGARKTNLMARLKDCGGLAGWRDAMGKIRDAPHLLGENDRGWRADLDFVLRKDKFVKLMEGGYARNSRKAPRPGGVDHADLADWVREREENSRHGERGQ